MMLDKANIRCNYCGTDKYINKFLLYVSLLLLGKRYFTCNCCGYTSRWVLVAYHVHETMDKREKESNKRFEDVKNDLYNRG